MMFTRPSQDDSVQDIKKTFNQIDLDKKVIIFEYLKIKKKFKINIYKMKMSIV
jgi:hypothetical protein